MGYPYNGRFRLTSGYKTTDRPDHTGIDLVGVNPNKFICAVVGGTVGASTIVIDRSNATWEWGNYVRIDGDDGLRYYYCHMSSRLVVKGQRVKAGDHVGIEGSTGYSPGSHLHFEVRNSDGRDIDPTKVLEIANAVGTYGDDYRAICAQRFGLDERTMLYLDGHPFAADLYRKLASAK